MKIGVVRYPGTNCYHDTIRYFGKENCIELLWDKYDERDHLDLLIIPGGFAFGDRYYEKATGEYEYSPGKMALESNIQKYILTLHEKGVPILGICNGFPHTKQHLEKGKEIKNESQEFNRKFLDDQKPQQIIGVFVALAILIIPSETVSLGPRGPSGVMPIYSLFLIFL